MVSLLCPCFLLPNTASFPASCQLALTSFFNIQFIIFFKDFIYLRARQGEERLRSREDGAGGEAGGEGDADASLSREPDAGLDPRTPGLHTT